MYYYTVKVDISGLLQYLGPFDCFRMRPLDGLNSRNTLPELPCLVHWENISAIENTKGVCHLRVLISLWLFYLSTRHCKTTSHANPTVNVHKQSNSEKLLKMFRKTIFRRFHCV